MTGPIQTLRIFRSDEAEEFFHAATYGIYFSKDNHGVAYLSAPCTFDIETSSWSVGEVKHRVKYACMYHWQLCLNGLVMCGRTWDEFMQLYEKMVEYYQLSLKRRIVIYIRNLGYEFQWIRKLLKWKEVFSVNTRTPLSALTVDGIVFKCSYLLSGLSLAKTGENLHKYTMFSKMVGDLDYEKLRTPETELTDEEMRYNINDVLVDACYIQECIEDEGYIFLIPKTKTGYVRRYTREKCLYGADEGPRRKNRKAKTFRDKIAALTIEVDEYLKLKEAFAGGFTHASPLRTSFTNAEMECPMIWKEVFSEDFSSSYPATFFKKFPMSKGELYRVKDLKDFNYQLRVYCCLFTVRITGLEPRIFYEQYISESKCLSLKGNVCSNGRVVWADELEITVTEQDWHIIKKCYKFKGFQVTYFRRYRKGYLPKEFLESVLDLYVAKTELKGVEGKEQEYMVSKGMLNAEYGCMVTDIAKPTIEYDNELGWDVPETPPDLEEVLQKYNTSKSRFLFYPWGVWVTAYARANLWTGILEMKEDYIYSDTDSIKGLNYQKHTAYFEEYNRIVTDEINRCLDHYGIDRGRACPKTVKGVPKPLGVWDSENQKGKDYAYDAFMTLGAKRYMVKAPGVLKAKGKTYNYSLTVSGINKFDAIPYMVEKWGDECMLHFNDELTIPAGYCGKNTHTYLDEAFTVEVVDYQGHKSTIHEESSVHLEATGYDLSMAAEFVEYLTLLNYKEVYNYES